jgi:hypothetical protein
VIQLRKAKLSDIPAVVDIAVESVSRNQWPVEIDRAAMAETAQTALNPAHFLWVAEADGKVVAAFGAVVQPSFWFKKLSCSVLLFYSRVPGAGLPLIREFIRWFKGRSAIKCVMWEVEQECDQRIAKFLRRAGFNREARTLTYVRGL